MAAAGAQRRLHIADLVEQHVAVVERAEEPLAPPSLSRSSAGGFAP